MFFNRKGYGRPKPAKGNRPLTGCKGKVKNNKTGGELHQNGGKNGPKCCFDSKCDTKFLENTNKTANPTQYTTMDASRWNSDAQQENSDH